MNDIKFSIIIPCYNVDKYISACLDSILNQDIDNQSVELICIDDCSTDNTLRILEKYASIYKNIVLKCHSINLGIGSSRNTGLNVARGKYIWFVDSDDLIANNCLPIIYDILESNYLDILYFNFSAINEDNSLQIDINDVVADSNCLSGIDYIIKYHNSSLTDLSMAWRCVYRTDFIINNKIVFPKMRVGEDAPFTWRAIMLSNKIMSIKERYYIYRRNQYSLTGSDITPEKLYEWSILSSYQMYKLYKEFHSVNFFDIYISNAIKYFANYRIEELISKDCMFKRKYCKMFYRNIKQSFIVYNYMTNRNKLNFAMICLGIK